jgi:NTE family protein
MMTGLSRRGFARSASLGAAGLATGAVLPGGPAMAQPAGYDDMTMAAQISRNLFADDGLARPAPESPTASDLAKGLDRTLVLGGGGEYYVAWYCGFLHGLYELEVDLNVAEMVVGTSAGAYAGSTLTSGHFKRLRTEFDFFGYFPSLFAKLAPVTRPNISQRRAQDINSNVKDGSPASIRAIGLAALAADNHLNGNGVDRLAGLLTGDSRTDWPVAKMYTMANDCYTGERLVVGQAAARKNGHSPGARRGRQLVAVRGDRSDPAGTALLHGWRHLAHVGAHRCRRRIETRVGDHADQRLRGLAAERDTAQHSWRDEDPGGDRHPGACSSSRGRQPA